MKINDVKSWGIDIGNVLIKNVPLHTQQYYAERQLPPEIIVNHLQLLPEALIGLRFLVHQVGRENVWIISKANAVQAAVNRLALEKLRVYIATGLDPEQVLFVPDNADKIPVIRTLELDGVIDDRGEVISAAQDFVPCPVWFKPTPADSEQWLSDMSYKVRVVSSWHQLMDIFST